MLGKPSADVDEPAAKTQQAYERIFTEMTHLKELEMRELSLQEINLSNRGVTQLIATSVTHAANCSSRIYRD